MTNWGKGWSKGLTKDTDERINKISGKNNGASKRKENPLAYELAKDINYLTMQIWGFDKTTRQIADELGVCFTTIIRGMNKHNILNCKDVIMSIQRDKNDNKLCNGCGKWLPIDNFSKSTNSPDGLYHICRICNSNMKKLCEHTLTIIALDIYSNGYMKCELCDEDDIDVLSFDHIMGGGRKHRETMKQTKIIEWFRDNNYPDGFRVLCRNCNWKENLKNSNHLYKF